MGVWEIGERQGRCMIIDEKSLDGLLVAWGLGRRHG